VPKALQIKGEADADAGRFLVGQEGDSCHCDDCTTTGNEPCSDKYSDKQTPHTPDLNELIQVCPSLPETIKAGILAMVRTWTQQEGDLSDQS